MASTTRAFPRRRKPSLLARMRPFWILGMIVGVFAVWAGYTLARAPWFRIAHLGIDVPAGSVVSAAQVRAAAAIPPRANVWLLDPGAIARRIEAIPYVERARMHRGQFPHPFVEIGVTLRRPSACVRGGEGVVTIDATSRVLQNGCAVASVAQIDAGAAALAAPGATLDDRDVARLLADEKVLTGANLSVRKLGRDRWGGLVAVDAGGVTLLFGDDADLAAKAALVGPVRAGLGTRRALRAIDLRAPRTPTAEFR
jgi:cell division septal protein FtsQ